MSPSIFRAIEGLSTGYFMHGMFRSDIHFPVHLNRILASECGRAPHHPVIRVDSFVDFKTQQIKILEFNTADPSAFSWNDWMIAGVEKLPGADLFFRDLELTSNRILPAYLAMVMARYHHFCRDHDCDEADTPMIGLSIKTDSSVFFDFCCLEVLLRSEGCRVVLIDPSELRIENGMVVSHNERIDILIRDTLDDVYCPESGAVLEPAATIMQKGLVCLVNPLSSTFGDQKMVLPVLLRALGSKSWCKLHGVDGENLSRWILETITVDWKSADILIGSRLEWVLKPSFGFGGHGVCLGIESSQSAWQDQIERICTGKTPFVAQKYVSAGVGEIAESGSYPGDPVKLRSVHANYSFWIIDGRFAGAFTRLSEQKIINTHQGGALVPVFYF